MIAQFLSCRFIAPIEGVGLVVWYIVGEIRDNPGTWWQFSTQSLAMVLTQVGVVCSKATVMFVGNKCVYMSCMLPKLSFFFTIDYFFFAPCAHTYIHVPCTHAVVSCSSSFDWTELVDEAVTNHCS